nr:hypothetical protein [Rhodohalobacter sp. SW132]
MKIKPRRYWATQEGRNESADKRDETNYCKNMEWPHADRLFVDRKRTDVH